MALFVGSTRFRAGASQAGTLTRLAYDWPASRLIGEKAGVPWQPLAVHPRASSTACTSRPKLTGVPAGGRATAPILASPLAQGRVQRTVTTSQGRPTRDGAAASGSDGRASFIVSV